MLHPNIICAILFLFTALMCGVHNLDYSDLEAMGAACSDRRDRCRGYRNNMTYMDRSCECDFACNTYKDCCIDANRVTNRRSSITNRMACMPYGEHNYQGVYMIVRCANNWEGPSQLRQKCEGPQDFSDPLNAAPVTSVAQGVTYRNRYCAECNRAHMPTLQTYQVRMSCDGLPFLTEEQIFADLEYNRVFDTWGVNRMRPHTVCVGDGGVFTKATFYSTQSLTSKKPLDLHLRDFELHEEVLLIAITEISSNRKLP